MGKNPLKGTHIRQFKKHLQKPSNFLYDHSLKNTSFV